MRLWQVIYIQLGSNSIAVQLVKAAHGSNPLLSFSFCILEFSLFCRYLFFTYFCFHHLLVLVFISECINFHFVNFHFR